jgi:hypothetical protein
MKKVLLTLVLAAMAAGCAVRGTEFTVDATPEGAMDIKVLYGEVKLNFTVPPVKGKAEIHIPQGQFLSLAEKGKPAKQSLLTKEQEYRALENWNPGLDPKERMAEIIEKENSRAQIKEFAKVTSGAEQQVKSFINTAKESDLEAGRTLNDVHGNLVRVEQRLIRPDPQTLQFFNIVKRPAYKDYSYATALAQQYGFKYAGGAVTNRLDLMQVNLKFDQALPQRIEEWPSFFDNSSINPDYMTVVSANRTNNDNIFFIAEGWLYDPVRDELVNNETVIGKPKTDDMDILFAGVLKGADAVSALGQISELKVSDGGSGVVTLTGPAVSLDAGSSMVWAQRVSGANYSKDSDDVAGNDQVWQFQADRYELGGLGATGTHMWFAKENYVIGNGGGLKNTEDFTSSGTDPFSILKETAGQTILYLKQHAATANDVRPGVGGQIKDADYFDQGAFPVKFNIDIVFIPDLAVAAIQRMLPAITSLND